MKGAMAASETYEIVVGVDYSSLSALALGAALDIASSRDARVHVIAVAQGEGPRLPEELKADEREHFIDEAQKTLEAFLTRELAGLERPARVNREQILDSVDVGDPAERILALAEEVHADLIVVGTTGRRGLEHLVLGSVAETVLRNAHCPVLVVRPKSHAAQG
jgi:nucleotide-binding universal stress UspA family protein